MNQMRFVVTSACILGALFASAAGAQQDSAHKPGGLNKVAHNVSATVKKAGRDTKSATKHAASATHGTLKRTGRGIKSDLNRATGDTLPKPHHKPGGLNKVARDASGAMKKVGRSAKSDLHQAGSSTHKTLQRTGNDAKAAVKDTTH
ncbi:MAG: hypothetical protein ACR2M1_14080 [Gemmatimonadaceae bacterium]